MPEVSTVRGQKREFTLVSAFNREPGASAFECASGLRTSGERVRVCVLAVSRRQSADDVRDVSPPSPLAPG
jgi:hypothetical protein